MRTPGGNASDGLEQRRIVVVRVRIVVVEWDVGAQPTEPMDAVDVVVGGCDLEGELQLFVVIDDLLCLVEAMDIVVGKGAAAVVVVAGKGRDEIQVAWREPVAPAFHRDPSFALADVVDAGEAAADGTEVPRGIQFRETLVEELKVEV